MIIQTRLRAWLRARFLWDRAFTQSVTRLALPIFFQGLIMYSFSLIDNVMVGQLGATEMAAVTQANRLTFLWQTSLFGLSGGTVAFASQYWGKRDIPHIHRVLGMALCTALSFAVVFMFLAIGMPGLVMRILLPEPVAQALGVSYLRIVGWAYLFQACTQIYAAILKQTERVKMPMFASMIAIVTNTTLNYGLIFGRLGLPRMGIPGAAIATVLSTALEATLIISIGYVRRYITAARLSAMIPREIELLRRYLRVVSTVIANEFIWGLGMAMYSIVYGRIGQSAVAAISIASTFEAVSVALMRGINAACGVLVGKQVGAGLREEANKVAQRLLGANFCAGFLCAGFLLTLSHTMMRRLYPVVEPEILQLALRIVWITASFLPINAFSSTLIVGILRAAGDTTCALIIDTAPEWLFGVPIVACMVLLFHWSLPLVLVILHCGSFIKSYFGYTRFRSGRWIHNLTIMASSDTG